MGRHRLRRWNDWCDRKRLETDRSNMRVIVHFLQPQGTFAHRELRKEMVMVTQSVLKRGGGASCRQPTVLGQEWSWQHVEHRLGGMLSIVVRVSTTPLPGTISDTGCPRVPIANDDTANVTCRGPRQKLSQGDSYLQSTLWHMISLLLNMQTDHLAITGKAHLKHTAWERPIFSPSQIYNCIYVYIYYTLT